MSKKGSKSKIITHSGLKTASYFSSPIFNSKESKFLFKIRARMLQVKGNFKQQYQNDMNSIICEKCPNNLIESQEHVINCTSLKEKSTVKYSDLFSTNLKIVKAALSGYMKAWNERNEENK